MIFQTGNNAPPQMCDFIIAVPDPSAHAHVTFSIRRNEARQQHEAGTLVTN